MRYILALLSCLKTCCLGSFPNPSQTHTASLRVPEIALQGGCITPAAPSESVRLDLMQVVIRLKRDSYSGGGRKGIGKKAFLNYYGNDQIAALSWNDKET
jgi:hypothetical protein